MTMLNVDSKTSYVQALEGGSAASLLCAVDLLDELGEIQRFLLSGAITGLPREYTTVLHERQDDLLSRVSLLVGHSLKAS